MSAPHGDGVETVRFLQQVQALHPEQKVTLIWDGAQYHRYGLTRDYLQALNQDKAPQDWQITCLLLAPNAPEQNPIEDVWLQAKRWIRKQWHQCDSFAAVKQLFLQAIVGQIFEFPKLIQYRCSHII